jgi:hypothetical protein
MNLKPTQACCSLNEYTNDFSISHYIYLLSAGQHHDIMTESLACFWKCGRTSGCRFSHNLSRSYIYTYIYTAIFVRSWWSEWGVAAATHCHSWWRWWANTLWVTLTRVVTTTLSYQYANIGLAGTVKKSVYFKQSFIVEFSLQSHICNLLNELVEKIQCSELTVTLLSVLWSVMGKTACECLSVWLVLNLMLIFSDVIG